MGAIASFYAEIGLETSKLQTGLKNAKTQMQNFGKGVNDAAQRLTGLNLTQISTAGLLYSGVKLISDSVKGWISYSNAMQDAARLTGTTTEEMSRLTQVADDVRLSQEQLKTAMTMASRQGIDVSIDGLKKLSDQYLALNPGVERSQFLLQTFGRTGADMGRLMEMGAAGIDKATAAVNSNLIVTDAAAKKAEEARLAMDNLNDTWTGMKNALAQAVIPALNEFLTAMNKGIDTGLRLANWNKEITGVLEQHETQVLKTASSYDDYIREMIRASLVAGKLKGDNKWMAEAFLEGAYSGEQLIEVLNALTDATGGVSRATYNAIKQENEFGDAGIAGARIIADYAEGVTGAADAVNNDLSAALNDFKIAMDGPVGDAAAAFADKMQELKDKSDELRGKIDELEGKKYLTGAQRNELDDLKGQFDDVQGEIAQTQSDYTRQTRQFIIDTLLQKASLLSPDDPEYKAAHESIMGLAEGWGLVDEATANTLIGINDLFLAMQDPRVAELAQEVGDLSAAIDSLNGKHVKITYESIFYETHISGNGGGAGSGGTTVRGYANGGSFIVPPGYPDDSYELFPGINAESGEKVTVTPANRVNNYNMTINAAQVRTETVTYGFRTMQLMEGI